ncbi:MAG: thioredoxin [bacterium]
MAGANILELEQGNWQSEVTESNIPVLVDFWAEWCSPCKAIGPVLEEMSKELAGKLKIAKVNVDQSPELAGQFGVRSIPTLLLIKNGKIEHSMVGAKSKAAMTSEIEPFLG